MHNPPRRSPKELRKLAEAGAKALGEMMLQALRRRDRAAMDAAKLALFAIDGLCEELDLREGLGPIESRARPELN